MGVVRRQSIKRTIISYLGVAIGVVSNLLIYPLAFDIYGLSQFIIASASIIIPFASLGVSRLTVRYFPDFRDPQKGHHGFLGLMMITFWIAFILFLIVLLFFETALFDLMALIGMDSDKFVENRYVIIIVSFFLIFNSILGQYSSNFKRIVVPEIYNNLLLKVALPALVLIFFYGYINQSEFKYLFAGAYLFVFLGLFSYVGYLGQLSWKVDFTFLKKPLIREMLVFGVFSALGTIGMLMSFRIDSIMITSYLDYESTGQYSFYSYMVNTMAIPYMSMMAIASPVIAQSLKDQDFGSISRLYKQSSETLFIAGLLIVLGGWLCMDSVLMITGKFDILEPLKPVFLLLAVGQLVNVTTGLNEPIIGYSKYYKFNLYALLVLSVLNIGLNIYLIPRYGLPGAATATAVSLVTYNIIKCWYIYYRFHILPFSVVHLKVLGIGLIAFVAVWWIDPDISVLLLLLIKGGLFVLLFGGTILWFGISKDINDLFQDMMSRLKLR